MDKQSELRGLPSRPRKTFDVSFAGLLGGYKRRYPDLHFSLYHVGPALYAEHGEAEFLWLVSTTQDGEIAVLQGDSAHVGVINGAHANTSFMGRSGCAYRLFVHSDDPNFVDLELETIALEVSSELSYMEGWSFNRLASRSVQTLLPRLYDRSLTRRRAHETRDEAVQRVAELATRELASSLDCVECTILLPSIRVDDLDDTTVVMPIATTCAGGNSNKTFTTSGSSSVSRVLLCGESIIESDLSQDWSISSAEYKQGAEPRDFAGQSGRLGASPLYPCFAYLAAPIKIDQQVVGVIRVSRPKTPPHAFTTWHGDFLELFGLRLGEIWREQRDAFLAEKHWDDVAAAMRTIWLEIGSDAHTEVGQIKRRASASCLEVLHRMLSCKTSACAVYLIEKNELVTAATEGAKWIEGDDKRQYWQQNRVFPIGDDATTHPLIVQCVLSEDEHDVRTIIDPDQMPGYSPTFKNVHAIYTARLDAAGEKSGCLEIQLFEGEELSESDLRLVEAVRIMFSGVLSAVEVMRHNEEIHQIQAQVIDDFHHQVGLPAYGLGITVSLMDRAFPNPDRELRSYMNNIRAFAGRVERIGELLNTLRLLASGQPLTPELADYSAADIQSVCANASRTAYYVNGLDMHQRGWEMIKIGSVQGEGKNRVKVDLSLFEQIVYNAIENAVKYSYRDEPVFVEVRDTKAAQIVVEVRNRGTPVTSLERTKVFRKYVQGGAGELSSDTGRGIGLWLASEIAKVHNAELDLWTDKKGYTRFTCSLPSFKEAT